jgi:hypothetical protein
MREIDFGWASKSSVRMKIMLGLPLSCATVGGPPIAIAHNSTPKAVEANKRTALLTSRTLLLWKTSSFFPATLTIASYSVVQ